jgi:hypothetical protein
MPNAEWRTSEEIGGDLGREVFTVALHHVHVNRRRGVGEKNRLVFFSLSHVLL